MGVRTLVRYLIGDRQAILEIAADRRAIWVGLLFVASAALARDYDGEDLLHEPWHLLLPLAASLIASFLLFLLTYGKVIAQDPHRPAFFAGYCSFLTLFWITAPLAWLYAIPYERFLSPVQAVEANLLTLALIAAWRVVLMVRVVHVLMGYTVLQAVILVMTFADAAALVAIYLMPKPVFAIMGGIHLTESERLILALSFNITCFGLLMAPIWLIGTLTILGTATPAWRGPPAVDSGSRRTLWALAVVSLAMWVPILPWTQAEQGLRVAVEHDLRSGRIAEGLSVMSAHARIDFPPLWDPPPRPGYGESSPPLWDVLEVVADQPLAEWVRRVYIDKLRQAIADEYHMYGMRGVGAARAVRILRRLPEGPALVADGRETFEFMLRSEDKLPPEVVAQLNELLGKAK